MTSSNSNYLPKATFPNTIALGVRASRYGLGQGTITKIFPHEHIKIFSILFRAAQCATVTSYIFNVETGKTEAVLNYFC